MEEKVINYSALTENWAALRADLKKTKKVDFTVFGDVFSKTYTLLSENTTEGCIDRKCAELAATAFLFASSETDELENRYRAALMLTERMITCCVFNHSSCDVEGTNIYIFEARKDIYINFKDVNDSLEKLEKLFQ